MGREVDYIFCMSTPKKSAAPPPAPERKYMLTVKFTPAERAELEALEREMHIPRSHVVKLLLADEFRRRGLKLK